MKTKGVEARERIVKAGIQIFAKKGFADASFREIAAQAKTKPPAVVYHFENKYALYRACIESVLKRFSGILEDTIQIQDDATQRLEKNLIANLKLADDYPAEVKIIVFLYFTASHDPEFKTIYTELVAEVRKRYLGILYSGVRERAFQLPASADATAELIHEAVIGSIVNYLSAARREDERKRILDKWAILITALTGSSPVQLSRLPRTKR